jgi:hypothetical protein
MNDNAVRQTDRINPIAGKPCSYKKKSDTTRLYNRPTIPLFVSCLSKDSACKPPTRVAGTFWA